MKIAILYGSPTRLTNAHILINHVGQPEYYVRMDTLEMGDDKAFHCSLDFARPMKGEIVLNTIEILGA